MRQIVWLEIMLYFHLYYVLPNEWQRDVRPDKYKVKQFDYAHFTEF